MQIKRLKNTNHHIICIKKESTSNLINVNYLLILWFVKVSLIFLQFCISISSLSINPLQKLHKIWSKHWGKILSEGTFVSKAQAVLDPSVVQRCRQWNLVTHNSGNSRVTEMWIQIHCLYCFWAFLKLEFWQMIFKCTFCVILIQRPLLCNWSSFAAPMTVKIQILLHNSFHLIV